jgi:hypothetical protein
MRTRTFVLCLSAALLAIAVGAQSLPLAGTWRASIAKSKYDPGPPPKVPGTLTWERVAGGWRFTTDGVDAQGQKTHTETMEKDDGSEVPVKGAASPTTRVFRRIDDRTYEDSDKVNGKPTVTRRGVISADGKTMTVTVTGTNAQGQKVSNVLVYEKQ